VDVWIEVRKHPQESKVYCSDDGRQTWSEVVKYKVGASPQYGSLQCALAEHLNLLDAEQMPASAQQEYANLVETLAKRPPVQYDDAAFIPM
jgi:hypothetical protein